MVLRNKKFYYNHFKWRLYERYSLDIDKIAYKQIIGKIKKQNGVFLKRISNRFTVWLVEYCNKNLIVIYDKDLKLLRTALPPNCIEIKQAMKDDKKKVKLKLINFYEQLKEEFDLDDLENTSLPIHKLIESLKYSNP